MVLSRIVLNLDAPSARRDLASRYEMHRTMSRLAPGGGNRILWRLETRGGTQPVVLVQTSDTPDPTSIAVTAPDYYVSFESRYNRLLENLRTGDRLRFKVFANASVKREGKRHGLYRQDDQLAWIEHQLLKHGAEPVAVRIGETSTERCWRGRDSRPISVYGVMFEGLLDVVDPNRVRDLVRNGLGHAKALGFGLVTLGR